MSKPKRHLSFKKMNYLNKKSGNCLVKGIIFSAIAIVVIGLVVFIYNMYSNDIKHNVLKLQYPQKYNDLVTKYSKEYNIDEDLIYSVIHTESHFKETAVSGVGAKGLMQIMPSTFEWLQEKQDIKNKYCEDDLFDPEINIKYGTYFLRILLNEYESEMSAIAAYNAGFVVTDWLNNSEYSSDGVNLTCIPYEETSNYVDKVSTAYKQYKNIY